MKITFSVPGVPTGFEGGGTRQRGKEGGFPPRGGTRIAEEYNGTGKAGNRLKSANILGFAEYSRENRD